MFHHLPNSAWADWNLAEVAVQLGKMVEHPSQSQPNPGLMADESPCIHVVRAQCSSDRTDTDYFRLEWQVLSGIRCLLYAYNIFSVEFSDTFFIHSLSVCHHFLESRHVQLFQVLLPMIVTDNINSSTEEQRLFCSK